MIPNEKGNFTLCGFCLRTVVALPSNRPDALGRAMVTHYRACTYPTASIAADRLEAELEERLPLVQPKKNVAA